jgi:hypothetical protein
MKYQINFLTGRPMEITATLLLVNNTSGDLVEGWSSEQPVFDLPGRAYNIFFLNS